MIDVLPRGDAFGVPGADLRDDLLSMAVRGAHVAVCVSTLPDGRFVEVNDAFCRLVQWPREALIGHGAAELGLSPDPGQRERLQAMVRRHGSVTGFEGCYCNRAGEQGLLEISASVVRRGGTEYFVAFCTELSGQREMVQALQAAQARLGVALRASGLLVFRQDQDLRYTWVANPALGASESDLIGRTDDEIMGAEAAAPLVAIKRRVLQTGQAERRDVWVANQRALGCFDVVVEPERDATGRVVAIVCAAQDITQRKTAAAGVDGASDLRQLLHAIRGMTSLIARERLTDWQLSRLQRIAREAELLHRRVGPTPPQPGDEGPPSAAAWSRQVLRQQHAGALVLVAERSDVLREQTAALLEDAGLRVALADSGVSAFSQSLQLAPSLLLLDMELPQRGGVAAARAVRAMSARRLPIVAMVSADWPGDTVAALDADLDDVIEKPVTPEMLYEKALAWLHA